MSANLEKTIHDEIRDLTDEQQRQVIAFVEGLKPKRPDSNETHYSFVGIAHSGKGSLSTEAKSLLEEAADRREGWSLR